MLIQNLYGIKVPASTSEFVPVEYVKSEPVAYVIKKSGTKANQLPSTAPPPSKDRKITDAKLFPKLRGWID